MDSMLKQLTQMKYNRALDVCCGAGEVIRDLLRFKFTEIDFFDQCHESVNLAMIIRTDYKLKGEATRACMEIFQPKKNYDCIVMRYCIGYLDDKKMIKFLYKIKHGLTNARKAS